MATTLLNEITKGNLTALIARSADLYGQRVRTSSASLLVFDKFAESAKASWLVNDTSVTFLDLYPRCRGKSGTAGRIRFGMEPDVGCSDGAESTDRQRVQ
jgi:hypothetical protein